MYNKLSVLQSKYKETLTLCMQDAQRSLLFAKLHPKNKIHLETYLDFVKQRFYFLDWSCLEFKCFQRLIQFTHLLLHKNTINILE